MGLRLSERLEAERQYLADKLLAVPICNRCGAKLADFTKKCTAELGESCPGSITLEMAKEQFNIEYKTKRS